MNTAVSARAERIIIDANDTIVSTIKITEAIDLFIICLLVVGCVHRLFRRLALLVNGRTSEIVLPEAFVFARSSTRIRRR